MQERCMLAYGWVLYFGSQSEVHILMGAFYYTRPVSNMRERTPDKAGEIAFTYLPMRFSATQNQ